MDKLQRMCLIKELESELLNLFQDFEKEKVFNTFLDTTRRFRADYYISEINCIIEINGGQFINGRHNRGGKGYENDLEKLNIANSRGVKVLQFTYEMLQRREYLPHLIRLKLTPN